MNAISAAVDNCMIEEILDNNHLELTLDEVDFLYAFLEKNSSEMKSIIEKSSNKDESIIRMLSNILNKFCKCVFENDPRIQVYMAQSDDVINKDFNNSVIYNNK